MYYEYYCSFSYFSSKGSSSSKKLFPLCKFVIDLLFVYEDIYYIVDYKTDKVDSLEELKDRYKIQLDLYEIGIRNIMNASNVKKYIYSYALVNSNKIIDVQLHGGEPMLYDIDKINSLLDRFPENVKTSITTNLVYILTKEKIALFKRMLPYDDVPFIMTSWDAGIRFVGKQENVWKKNILKLHENGIIV